LSFVLDEWGIFVNKSKKTIIVLTLSLVLTLFLCSGGTADIVYLKNGQELEGKTETTSEGVWVDGLLFKNDEIIRVEKKSLIRKNNKNKPWYQGALNLIGIKSEEQKRIEQLQNRFNKNTKMIKEMDSLYDEERKAAKRNNSKVYQRAKSTQINASHEELIKKMEGVSKKGSTYKGSTYKGSTYDH